MSRWRTVVLVVLAATAVVGVGGIVTGLWSVLFREDARIEGMAELVPWEDAIAVPTVPSRPTPTPGLDVRQHSTTDPASPWVIVNKQHPIDRAYAPADLVTVGEAQVRAAVEPDLRAMLDAAGAAGVDVVTSSGYRSYQDQAAARRSVEARRGFAHAERYSARPGFSEHQTGFALDVDSGSQPSCNYQTCFARTPEGIWLSEHAWEFGFVVRYTEANTAVTGYAPEGWHLRWVGRELTAHLRENGIGSLEEAFGVHGGPEYLEE
ncbi:peptidase M15B and M15C DD-carboxypeptidase VanY/endolysin [Cellulomonas flavigena DSM 20109]|uniref:Peptidase M15B and M15C DD-carboxypeptidase VanY/endolysin n=1 Tax=Cellulomonas flavigena (strain ATCC 482 / DSM 20109 / BCRC 11376 / JCM 18109 / NBRC 3775 / NCIMB 8073 / NRS 134) TaxID=446466 RepID=D5UKD6_CELFN|nr:M15 family metallopeptidase [Cellulomonas flavigena]ADG75797.1 peptidase M15B and M15C DD-carboxypeptidase VanY/endolysin [Cellulomonas flavigena DSM 20109]